MIFRRDDHPVRVCPPTLALADDQMHAGRLFTGCTLRPLTGGFAHGMPLVALDDYSTGSVIVGDQQALDGLAGSVVVPMAAVRGQDAGNVIMLPGVGDELLVKAVRLGQGGFISPCGRRMTPRPRQNG